MLVVGVFLALIVVILSAAVWFVKTGDPYQDPNAKYQFARELLRTDKRIAQAVMLLSYAGLENEEISHLQKKSNRRLILEIRQIVRLHMPKSATGDVNKVTSYLLVFSKNIAQKRRENANLSMQKCK